MELFIALVLGVLVIIGYRKYQVHLNNKMKVDALQRIPHFVASEYVISADNCYLMAVDKVNRKIAFVNTKGRNRVFGRNELISGDVLVNDVLQTKKGFVETWGKYYVMKTLFGENHATIAALNSSERTSKLITRISLKVSTRSLKTPYVEFLFYKNNSGETEVDFGLVYQWEGYVKAIVS